MTLKGNADLLYVVFGFLSEMSPSINVVHLHISSSVLEILSAGYFQIKHAPCSEPEIWLQFVMLCLACELLCPVTATCFF